MTTEKSERLLNLLITLLVSRHYVPKERIRRVVPQYHEDTDAGFEKKFERDKEELRSLGVPIEVGNVDAAFDDEPGYRIRRADFELPELTFEPDEAAVLGLAARVWQHAGLASATSDALMKLSAAGVEVDRAALDVVQPHLAVDEPAFEVVWEATQSRQVITFDYRRSGEEAASTRTVQPWGVVLARGRSYVVGLDVDRDAPRLFRLSRIQGKVTGQGRGGAFEVPAGTDIKALSRSLAPAPLQHHAKVLVRPGAGHGLRRHAAVLESGVSGPGGEAWDVLDVAYADVASLGDELLHYGADVVAVSPDELRDSVVQRLRSALSGVNQ